MIITPLLIVLLIIVFVLLWLFIKTIDKRKWLTFILSLALTPLVYFYLFYPLINIFSSYHHQKHFNTEAWSEKPALRYEMVDHIISSQLLIGKTKSQVASNLGNSEWLSWSNELKQHDSNYWNYNLGIKPGAFNDKQECLTLKFKDDIATTVNRYQLDISFEDTKTND